MKRTRMPMVRVVSTIWVGVLAAGCVFPACSQSLPPRNCCSSAPAMRALLRPPVRSNSPAGGLGRTISGCGLIGLRFSPTPVLSSRAVFSVHGNRTRCMRCRGSGLGRILGTERSGGRPAVPLCDLVLAVRPDPGPKSAGRSGQGVRSELDSYYLAAMLDRMPPIAPVCLIGYSFVSDDRRDFGATSRRRVCRPHTSQARGSAEAYPCRPLGSGHGCGSFGPGRRG